MAYEYGYSLESPKNLCLWEAQFGDFYNPAQLMIDQYLMCSEAKWLRQSGLVLLLPHGFDGAGPEHSTCHIERFLQNVNSNAYDTLDMEAYKHLTGQNINFQVAQCSTPANYFHILRRQQHRTFRKPLVMAAPKIVLKHPLAVSEGWHEFAEGTSFKPVIENTYGEGANGITILCSGKIFYDLHALLTSKDFTLPSDRNVQILRVEELAPFPAQLLESEFLAASSPASKVCWIQEEPANQGAFQFAKLHIDRILEGLDFDQQEMDFIGRPSMHSFCSGAAVDNKAQG